MVMVLSPHSEKHSHRGQVSHTDQVEPDRASMKEPSGRDPALGFCLPQVLPFAPSEYLFDAPADDLG